MSSLTKDQILAADQAKSLAVQVPEWPDASGVPGVVYIRVMTVGERDAWELEVLRSEKKGVDDFRSRYLARVLSSDHLGTPLFSDWQQIKPLSGAVCNRLFNIAKKHNDLNEEEVQALGKS